MPLPGCYKDREQAFVKHTLLKAYLKRLFMIIGQFQDHVRYVDCFAGPWQEDGKDLHGTSIGISLDIMRQCRESLQKMGHDVTFHALFIEKNKKKGQVRSWLLKEKERKKVNRRSTIVTSQLPVKSWHEYIDDPSMADAILDRLVHNAYRIAFTEDGDSMRKKCLN